MAGFRFQIGANKRDAGEVGINRISKELIRSPRGIKQWRRETWDLTGMIQVNSASEIDAAMLLFERELTDGSDVKFLNANGKTTAHEIRSAETANGVNIIKLEWLSSQGAEHGVYRSYNLQVEAMYRLAGRNALREFRESITFIGGGPMDVWTNLSRGRPRKQRIYDQTTYKAIQAGSAVGELYEPNYPGPLWPALEHRPRRIEEPSSPQLEMGVFGGYGIRWQYEFESDRPLFGTPHLG